MLCFYMGLSIKVKHVGRKHGVSFSFQDAVGHIEKHAEDDSKIDS